MIAIRVVAFILALFTGSAAIADRETRQDREEREEREEYEERYGSGADIPLCAGCRNLRLFPIDGANFSLNQVWGPDSWMTAEEADKFRIRDRYGNVLSVDLNLQLNMLWEPFPSLPFPFRSIIPWPSDLKLQILMRDRYHRLVHKDIFRPKDVNWPLPVGHDGGTSDGRYDDEDDDEDEDRDDPSGEREDDDVDYDDDDWGDDDLDGDECESCTAAFDADEDGELDRNDDGELIEYEL